VIRKSSVGFVPVKLRSLPIDLYLDCKVYFEKPLDVVEVGGPENELILLCENQTVTPEMLNRLKRSIFPKNKVFISEEYVKKLLGDGHTLGFTDQEIKDILSDKKPWEDKQSKTVITPRRKLEKIKPLTGIEVFKDKIYKLEKVIEKYDDSKKETEDLIAEVKKSGRVDKDKGAQIAAKIREQIKTEDSSLVLYAINQIRREDEYLYTHCLNVAYLNGLVGKWLKLSEAELSDLVEVGLFHDIGKLKIDQKILNKPGGLTDEEFEEVKRHPILSLEMLMKSGVRNKRVLEGVIQHHEKTNGTGYPKGLVSHNITDFARITAISDVYDAMVTKRVYKEACSPFVVLNEFLKAGHSELDLKFVNIFINCIADELKGKVVIMNDGSEATVRLVNPRKVLYPIVEINGTVITTDDTLFCDKMKNILGN